MQQGMDYYYQDYQPSMPPVPQLSTYAYQLKNNKVVLGDKGLHGRATDTVTHVTLEHLPRAQTIYLQSAKGSVKVGDTIQSGDGHEIQLMPAPSNT